MKNMDMQTAASAIRGMYCMLKEMDCLTAEVERLTAENVNLRSKCERLREFVVYRDGSTGEYRVVCSACGWALRAKGVYRYCPNCGARVTGD